MRSGRGQGSAAPFSLTPTEEGPAYNTGSSFPITHGHDDSVAVENKTKFIGSLPKHLSPGTLLQSQGCHAP